MEQVATKAEYCMGVAPKEGASLSTIYISPSNRIVQLLSNGHELVGTSGTGSACACHSSKGLIVLRAPNGSTSYHCAFCETVHSSGKHHDPAKLVDLICLSSGMLMVIPGDKMNLFDNLEYGEIEAISGKMCAHCSRSAEHLVLKENEQGVHVCVNCWEITSQS